LLASTTFTPHEQMLLLHRSSRFLFVLHLHSLALLDSSNLVELAAELSR
jgi:hypothetical protein